MKIGSHLQSRRQSPWGAGWERGQADYLLSDTPVFAGGKLPLFHAWVIPAAQRR